MMLPVGNAREAEPTRAARFMPLIAAPVGYLAGLVGIGGGIFLAPLLHLTCWRDARAIAATASLFILVNSLFGLAGQRSEEHTSELQSLMRISYAVFCLKKKKANNT